MSTIRELVTEAFRENNLIQVGDTPDGAEYTEAEKRLLRIISALFGAGFGEPLVSSVVDYSTQATGLPINTRILVTEDTQSTIYLPRLPCDGARVAVVDPAGLLSTSNVVLSPLAGTIEGAETLTLSTDNLLREWFYRADTGNWVRVTDLTDDDDSPFPAEFDDLLIQSLSMRIAPRYGTATANESARVFSEMTRMFKARYRQTQSMEVDQGLKNRNENYTFNFDGR